MKSILASRWSWVLFTFIALLTNMGGGCPVPGPGPGPGPGVTPFVEVELVNTTDFPVDPGLFVDDIFFPIDPVLDPGEVVVLEFDCFPFMTLQTDAILLEPFFDVPSLNAPFVEEDFDFLCSDRFGFDTVSFIFVDDGFDFFTEVEVNGVLIITVD